MDRQTRESVNKEMAEMFAAKRKLETDLGTETQRRETVERELGMHLMGP